ncbi:MAG: hypothetical protein SOZ67_00890, partial [Alloprevotella sp.]|nr:hypothetical protein [Alloprevotella sp.]
ESYPLTDFYLQVRQESGELRIYDDDETELTRCVVEEWMDNSDENFYDAVQPVLRKAILNIREVTENVAVLKPYSFVLTGEDNECIAELHLVDDDTMLVSEDLMQGLGEDLDAFWKRLSEE